jgi:hypothetical protein
MKRSFKALLTAVLIAVPMLASCSDIQGPEVPPTNIERQDGLLGGLVGGLVGGVVELVGDVVGLLGSILTGPDANGSAVSAWIDSDGGTIKTAAYTLTVPRGAVRKDTKFEVRPTNTGAYMLELKAYEKGLLGLVSVGHKGFRKPVLLTISYAKAEGVTDVRKLGIIYIVAPDQVELQKTSVDTRNRTVTSPLSHFSRYAMVQN